MTWQVVFVGRKTEGLIRTGQNGRGINGGREIWNLKKFDDAIKMMSAKFSNQGEYFWSNFQHI